MSVMLMLAICYFSKHLTHQVVQLWILAEEGFVILLLLVHKVFNVHVEAG